MFTLTELQANVTKAERPPISPDQFVDGTQNCWHMATRSGLFWATIQEAVGASTMFLWIWFLMWTGISFVGGNFLKGKIVFWKGHVLLKSIKLWQKTVFLGGRECCHIHVYWLERKKEMCFTTMPHHSQ